MLRDAKFIFGRVNTFLTELFRDRDDFRLRHGPAPLPVCKLRLLREEDYEACEEIYLLNEAAHFPLGYFERFRLSMRGKEALYVVVEVDGAVRGFGGIAQYAAPVQPRMAEFASLMYGMVHPKFQRQGYGTILLLTRMALLPQPRRVWIVTLSTTGGSETFYGQFGFSFAGVHQRPEDGLERPQYYVKVNGERNVCRRVLKQAGVVLDLKGATVPLVKPKVKLQPENGLAKASA